MVNHAVLHPDGSYTYGGGHGEWEHDGSFCADGLFYPDRSPSTGAKIMRFIYRPLRVSPAGGSAFEIYNTQAFSNASCWTLTFSWNDGTEQSVSPDTVPLSRSVVKLPAGKDVDGTRICIVTTRDARIGETVAEEQLILFLQVPAAPETCPPDAAFSVKDGRLTVTAGGVPAAAKAEEGTILYRAGTDNDTDPLFAYTMKPFLAQKESLVSCEKMEKDWRLVSRVTNRKAAFEVTDTYEGRPHGLLVTSRIRCLRGGSILPRFGKAFHLDSAFDEVEYKGRIGESYIDMKDQFPLGTVSCHVADMTEPNLRPPRKAATAAIASRPSCPTGRRRYASGRWINPSNWW